MLRILYKSDSLIAVNKPAGMIVHGDGSSQRTLTDLLKEDLPRIYPDAKACSRARSDLQALQRLDRDTTGIVLFSCDKRHQADYDRLIAAHELEKRYLAVVEGAVPWRTRVFDKPIGRDRHDSRKMRISRTGKTARTIARRLETATARGGTVTLLDVLIETGRKHQIRVHLSSAGHPIVGDALYGSPGRRGLMLHAARMSFSDPVTGDEVRITAPAPRAMSELFPSLR